MKIFVRTRGRRKKSKHLHDILTILYSHHTEIKHNTIPKKDAGIIHQLSGNILIRNMLYTASNSCRASLTPSI